MSVFTNQQLVRVTYTVTEQFRVPVGIDLNDETSVESYSVKYNELHIIFKDGREQVVQSEYNMPDTFDWKRPDEYRVEDEVVEVTNDEVANDICEACGAERRPNYDWAFRDDGKKSFCRPCGKKFDNGELDK